MLRIGVVDGRNTRAGVGGGYLVLFTPDGEDISRRALRGFVKSTKRIVS